MYKYVSALVVCTICGGAQASIGSWIEPNLGQTDAAVKAIARDGDLTMLLESHRARVLLPRSETIAVGNTGQTVEKKSSLLLELIFHGADAKADAIMGAPRGTVSRYFRGRRRR